MRHLYYVLTARCNEKCAICPRTGNERIRDADYDANLEKLEQLIREKQVTDITVSGGEPTVYMDFPRVMRLLDRLEVNVTILSNSLRAGKKEIAEELYGGIEHKERFRVITAIHGLTPAVHEGVTLVKGSLERSAQGLKNIDELGISVTVKCVIGSLNKEMLRDYPDWVRTHVSERAGLLYCGMDYAGMSEELTEKYKLDFKDARKSLEEGLDAAYDPEHKGRIVLSEIPLCAVDPYYWNLFLAPPPQESVYDDSHWEAATESKLDIGPMTKACVECIAKPYCSGIWRTQYLVYGEGAVRPFHANS